MVHGVISIDMHPGLRHTQRSVQSRNLQDESTVCSPCVFWRLKEYTVLRVGAALDYHLGSRPICV